MKSWTVRSPNGRRAPRAARSMRPTPAATVSRRRCRFAPRIWAASPAPCRRGRGAPAKSTPTISRPSTRPTRQLEIEADAESAFDFEPEPGYQDEGRRYLEEHFEKVRVVEHQIQAYRCARHEVDAVAAAVAPPDDAAAAPHVPVELGLT